MIPNDSIRGVDETMDEEKKKLEETFSKDFIKGLETGLQISKDVAKREGLNLTFPDVKEMMAEQIKK